MESVKTFLAIPIFAALGIILAGILEVMYDKGYVIDEYIAGTITVADVQIIIVVICVVMGIISGVISRR